jgi:hypothetical protein
VVDLSEFLRLIWTEFPLPDQREIAPKDEYWLSLFHNKSVSLNKLLSSIVINQCCLRCCDIDDLVTRLNNTIQFVRTSVRAPLTSGLFPHPGVRSGLYDRKTQDEVVRQHFERSTNTVCQDWIVNFFQNVPLVPRESSRMIEHQESFDEASDRMTRMRVAYLRNRRPIECKVCDVACPFQPDHHRRLPEAKLDSSIVLEHASSRSSASSLWRFCKYCVIHDLPFYHAFLMCPVWNFYGRPQWKRQRYIQMTAHTRKSRR